MVEGVDILELSTVIKGEARFFAFTVDEEKGTRVGDLDLPEHAKVVCSYHDGNFALANDDTKLRKGDEVVILTHSEVIDELRNRWAPKQASNDDT